MKLLFSLPRTVVKGRSMEELYELPLKSMLTRGSSTASRMPLKRGCLGGIAECLAQFFGGGFFFEFSGEIHHGNCGGRDAQGITIELALQVGDDQGDGLGSASGGWDDVQTGRRGRGAGLNAACRAPSGRWCRSGWWS